MLDVVEPTIDELFAQTLKEDIDDEAAWAAIRNLHRLATREVFERAANWCLTDDPKKRQRGVDVLAQIGSTAESPGNKYANESFEIISNRIAGELDAAVLHSELIALGHIGVKEAIPILVIHSSHSDSEIRWAATWAFCSFANDSRCIEPLLRLMKDSDDEVRDWATFALASQGDLDSDIIRDSFLQGLDDSSEDVREEALVGLARREDLRGLPTLIASLKTGEEKVRVIEAASNFLGMDQEPGDWDSEDYLTALEQRFPNEKSPAS